MSQRSRSRLKKKNSELESLQKNIPGAGADKLRILVYIIIKRTLTSTLQVYVRERESDKRECKGSREGEGVSRPELLNK